ncbi:MAG TPA: TRAP transporter substrate-binding protein [Syntrophomonadaceae bacterium]|nr:TRAP transporter substrate-binding protein [Syntrophomonadaceae bacterium]HPR94516.1 TRAP transporter substrate-binding protein [Syntrophomonadaceae bacterium]
MGKGLVKGLRCKGKFSAGRMVIAGILLVLLLTMVSGCDKNESASADAADNDGKQIELKLAHFWPATHPAETDLVQPWAAAIEQATDGQVKITSYPGETLLKAADIYGGVRDGIADIGISCFSYTRGNFPVSEVFELPGITYNNSKVASMVAWQGLMELNPAEVQDTHLLMVITTGPGDLFTREPVNNLQDLQGMEIRATGLSAATLQALGATPVAMPQSEAYEALSKGVVKGNLGPLEVLQGWKQAEVTDYITRTPFLYNTLFFVTMNEDVWNSLDPETQQTIERVSREYFEQVGMGLWDKQDEAAMNGAIKDNAMEIITLTPEETDKWIKLVGPVQQDFVSRMDEQGLNGQEILDKVKALADKYNREFK